jgi:hypothetical protein
MEGRMGDAAGSLSAELCLYKIFQSVFADIIIGNSERHRITKNQVSRPIFTVEGIDKLLK